jgi:hypothetical protein
MSDHGRAFLGAVETARYRDCSDAQEPEPLSYPENAIRSGIGWSTRVTKWVIRPKRRILEKMCIFGHHS